MRRQPTLLTLLLPLALALGAVPSAASASAADDAWSAYLDYAYVYSSADAKALRARLDQYGQEAGVSLEAYLAGDFGHDLDGEPEAATRRRAIARLLLYLATGDSESLVVGQRGKVKFQTVSHSPVGYAVEAGVLEPEEGMEHEDRHVISNYVGMSGMRVEMTTAITLAPRDTVVLASDGLWDNLHVTEVAEIVRKGPLLNAASTLAQRCLERMRGGHPTISGKPDDLTLILYRTA